MILIYNLLLVGVFTSKMMKFSKQMNCQEKP